VRLAIIGNAGSGKTWLARRLSEQLGHPLIQLDDIFWMQGGALRGPTDAERRAVAEHIAQEKARSAWIMEGAHSHLAREFLDRASALLWLDLPWELCRDRILERRAEAQRRNEPAYASSDAFIEWASHYRGRDGDVSWSAHARLFEDFGGQRLRVQAPDELDVWLKELECSGC
jgi:adenylate kinase family enzyme